MIRLTYGTTNTYFIDGLLVDTGYAGTLQAFYRALKDSGLQAGDIRYMLATHYHPDHMGLIGILAQRGAKLLIADTQTEMLHFSDRIFERDRLPFVPIDEARAAVFPCTESRTFLKRIGIAGEILSTPSHSPDSITLALDDGNCFVGDLAPAEYAEAWGDPEMLKKDWQRISALKPAKIHFAHMPERAWGRA